LSLAEPKERVHFQSKVEAMDKSADGQRDFDAFVLSAKGETSTKSFFSHEIHEKGGRKAAFSNAPSRQFPVCCLSILQFGVSFVYFVYFVVPPPRMPGGQDHRRQFHGGVQERGPGAELRAGLARELRFQQANPIHQRQEPHQCAAHFYRLAFAARAGGFFQ
jgi:hypothetical protein